MKSPVEALAARRKALDEMAKREVVCANCHRRRTARRKGFLRAVFTGMIEAGDGT